MSFSTAIQSLLKTIIGVTREEIWTETAAEINGAYESGGMWQSDKIILEYKNRKIVLDMSAVTKGKSGALYSRFTMLFKNQNGFWFSIQNKSFTSSNKLNIKELDDAFYFSGSNIEQLKAFFQNSKLANLLLEIKKADFGIKNKESFFGHVFPGETVQLQFLSDDISTEKEQLKKVFQLFCVTIDSLIEFETMANRENEIAVKPVQ